MEQSICKTKVHFDTEFEAERGASFAEWRYGKEYTTYKCGPHYHITSKNPEERRGFGNNSFRCKFCGQIIKKRKKVEHKEKHKSN